MLITNRGSGPRLVGQIGGTPVREFLLIPFGRVEVDQALRGGSFTFTRRHAQSIVGWFTSLGRSLAIDFEHQSFELTKRPDALMPAAGWIGGLEIRPDGVWATRVEWTEPARQLIASGQYRYFSPVIYWSDEEYTDVRALGPVGLTNDPAMKGVAPLVASRKTGASDMYVTILTAKPLALTSPFALRGTTGDDDELDVGGIPRRRTGVIGRARAEYAALAAQGHSKRTQSELDFVNRALQQNAQQPLSEEEIVTLDIGTIDPRLSEGEIEAADRATFAASTALRGEFGDVEVYLAYQGAKRRGCVRIYRRQLTAATPSATSKNGVFGGGDTEESWGTIYKHSRELQAEFGDEEAYMAFKRAEAAGLVRILRNSPGVVGG